MKKGDLSHLEIRKESANFVVTMKLEKKEEGK